MNVHYEPVEKWTITDVLRIGVCLQPRYYVIVPEEASGVGEHTEVCLKPEGSGNHIWVMLEEAEAMRQKYKEYTDAIKKPAKRQHLPKKKVTSPPAPKRPKTSGTYLHGLWFYKLFHDHSYLLWRRCSRRRQASWACRDQGQERRGGGGIPR